MVVEKPTIGQRLGLGLALSDRGQIRPKKVVKESKRENVLPNEKKYPQACWH